MSKIFLLAGIGGCFGGVWGVCLWGFGGIWGARKVWIKKNLGTKRKMFKCILKAFQSIQKPCKKCRNANIQFAETSSVVRKELQGGFLKVFELFIGQFSQYWSNELLFRFSTRFGARFLTRFLIRVLTRVRGRGKTINTLYSTTRPKENTLKTYV